MAFGRGLQRAVAVMRHRRTGQYWLPAVQGLHQFQRLPAAFRQRGRRGRRYDADQHVKQRG